MFREYFEKKNNDNNNNENAKFTRRLKDKNFILGIKPIGIGYFYDGLRLLQNGSIVIGLVGRGM